MKRKRYPQIRFKVFNNDWEQRKVGDYGKIVTGNTPSTQKEEYYSEDGILWVTPTDISSNIIKDTAKKLSNEGIKVARKLPKNSILVTCIASIGKNTMLENIGSCNQQINAVIPNTKNYNPYFLLTESELWSIEMKKSAAAGTMQIVNKTEFSEVNTYAPKIEEQVKLGHMFKQIDNLITLHQNKHDKLVEIKKSLLEKMFPKNNKKIPEIRFKGFTDNWKQHKLDELGIIQTGNTPSTVKKEYYSNTGIQWVTPTDITDNVIRTTERKLSRIGAKVGRIVPPNTILVTCIASIGKNAIVTEKSAFNQQINSLTPYFEKHNPYFLLADSINWSNTMKKEAGGLTFQIVNKSQFSKIETKVPKEKQEEEKIGVLFKTIDKLVTLYQHNLINLINLKKTLLRKMFI